MNMNKKLLPIKGHFFLFNAGTAPLVPYLSTYARQLGFSSATVGVIYTVLPIFGLIAKPLFGWIADKFRIQKTIFIIFEIITILGFGAIYFIPESPATVQMECENNQIQIKACSNTNISGEVNLLKYNYLNKTSCKMNCDMTSEDMRKLLCEQWKISQYCSTSNSRFKYVAHIEKVTADSHACLNASVSNVILDGYTFSPYCRYKEGDAGRCRLNCSGANVTVEADAQCINDTLNYRICPTGDRFPISMATKMLKNNCEVECDFREESMKSVVCEEWQANIAPTCQYDKYVSNIYFTGNLMPAKAEIHENCINLPLLELQTLDNSTFVPRCILSKQMESFRTLCSIKCNQLVMNEIIQESATDTLQFVLFFLLMIINWVGQAVVVTFADAICFNLLGAKAVHYGKQRLWGSIGWGIFSLLTGSLIDLFSEGVYKDYTVAFVLMFVFLLGDVIVSCFLQVEQTQMSFNILQDVSLLLTSLPTVIFFLWTIAVGLCTGLLWNFLFWHIEDIAAMYSHGNEYVKTLQGLVSAIQAFGGEIPFMFLSGFILNKIGHVNMMSFVLLAFGVRFLLYSTVTNAWWILPIELLQGVTFGMFYPTMTSYASVVAPHGTETTVQGLVGAIFEGVGVSLGSLIGGQIFEVIGGWNTFRWFGCGALVACVLHYFVQRLVKANMDKSQKHET